MTGTFLAAFFDRVTRRIPLRVLGRSVIALLAERIPRSDRIALPTGRRRHLVAAHHQRGGPDGGTRTKARRGQRDTMRTQCRTLFEHNGVHSHHAVVEQVRLHDAAPVDGGALLQRDEVGLGKPVGLTPDAPADFGAERTQPHVHHRRAGGGSCEPRPGHGLDERVGHLVAPDERRPQRVLDGADTAHHNPFRDHRDSACDGSRGQQHNAATQRCPQVAELDDRELKREEDARPRSRM